MKIKVSEATKLQINWLVASIEFDAGNICVKAFIPGHSYVLVFHEADAPEKGGVEWAPSTDWSQGGPIIEREDICFVSKKFLNDPERQQLAWLPGDSIMSGQFGPTKLVAAMRRYVASKLGDEVEVPDELA